MHVKFNTNKKPLALLFFLIGIFFINPVKGSIPDSLLLNYRSAPNDSVKNIALKSLINYWKKNNSDSCMKYSKKIVRLAKKTKQYHNGYKGYFWIANIYSSRGTYDSAIYYAYDALKLYENDITKRAAFYKTNLYNLLGEAYRGSSQHKTALKYFNKSLSLINEYGFTSLKSSLANRMAATYYEMKDKDKALRWADSSLQIAVANNKINLQINNLQIISAVYRDQGQYKKALKILFQILSLQKKYEGDMLLAGTLNNIATTYSYLGDCKSAIKYAEKSYKYSASLDQKVYMVVSTELLAQCNAKIGNYKEGYKYARLYEEIRHFLFNKDRDTQINTLSAKYKLNEKNKQIVLQQLDIEKKNNKIKRNNIILIAFLIILILVVAFLANRITLNRKLRKAHAFQKKQTKLIRAQKDEIEQYAEEIKTTYDQLCKLDEHKQAMTNMIVHDLKSPISVLADIDMFGSEAEKRPVIKAISYQMMNLVLNMLDVSKAESGEMNLKKTEVNLLDIVNAVLHHAEYFIKDKNIHIENNINPTYSVIADKTIFKRILANLLGNAIKFSYSGLKIILSTEIDENKNLIISIKDFGIGIAKEHQSLIFEKFKQINKSDSDNIKSTGLGLAFCKMATEAHNWKIGVDSEPDKGATFYVVINNFIVKTDNSES